MVTDLDPQLTIHNNFASNQQAIAVSIGVDVNDHRHVVLPGQVSPGANAPVSLARGRGSTRVSPGWGVQGVACRLT